MSEANFGDEINDQEESEFDPNAYGTEFLRLREYWITMQCQLDETYEKLNKRET